MAGTGRGENVFDKLLETLQRMTGASICSLTVVDFLPSYACMHACSGFTYIFESSVKSRPE